MAVAIHMRMDCTYPISHTQGLVPFYSSVLGLNFEVVFSVLFVVIPYRFRALSGELQEQIRDQQRACAFHSDIRLCPCNSGGTDQQQ